MYHTVYYLMFDNLRTYSDYDSMTWPPRSMSQRLTTSLGLSQYIVQTKLFELLIAAAAFLAYILEMRLSCLLTAHYEGATRSETISWWKGKRVAT